MYLYQHNHTEEDGTVSTDYYSVPEDDHSPVRPEDEARETEQIIANERIAEMLSEINAAGDDHFDVAYSWDEYDGATTAAQYAETDAAYVLSDGTVIEYDEPDHAFVARRES